MVMAQPSPQQVGREFVRQYYTVLHEAPEVLHRFYSSGSTFVHGGVDRPGPNGAGHVEEPVVGQFEIDKKIRSLGFKDCHTKIRQVDAQATIGSGVVVQVTGELSNNGEPMRRFMQTFVLAPQTPKKFYVHNDIFRYQDEVYQDVSDTESEEVHVQQQQQAANAASSQPTTTATQQQPAVELKPAEVVVDGSSNNVELVDHHDHHHVEQTIGSSASSTTSSTSSASVPGTESVIVENHVHHEPPQQQQQHEENKTTQQPAVVQQEVERKQVDSAPSKENGPSETKPSSWARIIGKGEPGSSQQSTTTTPSTTATTTTTTTTTTAPSTTTTSNYSSNSLPRSNNKENRNFNKQNGGGTFNGQKPQSGKPRNTNSFGTSATNTSQSPQQQQQQQQQAQTTPAPAQQQPQQPAVARQNGGSEAGGDDSAADADKRFAGSTRHPDTHQVFVGNLSQDLSDAELKAFFNQFGRVLEVRINSNTKQQSGRRLPNYGFVVFDDARAVENVLSSTKANNLTLKNEKGEFRLNIEEKRARQGRQSSGFGGNKPAARSTRSTSNGSGNGGGGPQMNGKKPQYNRGEVVGGGDDKRTSTSTYQRRS